MSLHAFTRPLSRPLAGPEAEAAQARTIQRRTDPNYVCLIDGLCFSLRDDGLWCYPSERSADAVRLASSGFRMTALNALQDGHYTARQVYEVFAHGPAPEWMSR